MSFLLGSAHSSRTAWPGWALLHHPTGLWTAQYRARTVFSMRPAAAAVAGMAATAVTLSLASPAAGRVLERGTFHEEGSFRERNFCDVRGLTVDIDFEVDGRFMIKSRGRDQLPYYQQHGSLTEVITNVATGENVTHVQHALYKDHRVTDNGDGTLTLLVLATGNGVVYDASGKAIARNPGQVRFELLIDHGGTPQDPSDDEFLEFLGVVKESTGRSDDFCAATVVAIG